MGQIGGSLGMALLARRLTRRVIGIDRDARTRRRALARRACTEATADLRAVAAADLVVLAVPVRAIERLAPRAARLRRPGALLTDTGSVKAGVVRALRGAPGCAGGHPMCGSERGGIEAADPRLFEGRPWVLVPGDRRALPPLARLARAVGARPAVLDAAAHDRAAAVVSHLPYAFALALAALARRPRGLADPRLCARLAAGSFRSATRVAAQPAAMGLDILLANRFPLARALERMAAAFRGLAADLRRGGGRAARRLVREGRA